jgi:phage baseplate assembly protein V
MTGINGVIVAIDAAACKVRVQFPDHDELVSDWLPVGQRKALGDFDYWLPDLGTQVYCLMDEHFEDGVVLCAIYSDADPPPVTNANLFYKKFADGTVLQYDRAGHKLTVDVKGEIDARADIQAVITSPLVKAVASIKVVCDTPLTECTGNLSVAGGITCVGTYGATGGKIVTPGDIQSTAGNVQDSVRTMAGDRAIYNGHTHTDPQGGSTGGPNQGM